MAHWCRICGRHKSNERFSGKGHRDHICKECARKPKAVRDTIDHEREILGYFQQRSISKKNLKRLLVLAESQNSTISALADAVFSAGNAKSHKRKRLEFLARYHPDAMEKLGAVGLIIPPAEYRAMRFAEYDSEWDEFAVYLFDREMSKLHASGEHVIDPEEVELLFSDFSMILGNETLRGHPYVGPCKSSGVARYFEWAHYRRAFR